MNVRFAEPCRDKPLELTEAEDNVRRSSIFDGRSQRDQQFKCEQDIFIGVFFDGTNNNKYRDTPGFSHSNVARLYEAYPGTNAAQTTPTLRPRIKPDGGTEPRTIFPDKPFKASSVPADEYPYYRKIYVPGLGTPMPDARDSGTGTQKRGGLGMALLSQVRLDWAILQLVNQVHAAVFSVPLEASVDMGQLYRRTSKTNSPDWYGPGDMSAQAGQLVQEQIQKWWQDFSETTGSYDTSAFNKLVDSYAQRLGAALKARGNNKPDVRKIRLSVFGFSRGAAEARAWVNMITNRWGDALAGIPLQIDFLGVFDTVASVGLAQTTPLRWSSGFEGHGSWADVSAMTVPPNVKRCVHLVAAFEVRGSFPLDSICQGHSLPVNCKEIVYPGVHSDVGGGYPPGDQGRALGQGAEGDQFKLSQISLAQMYREARMAGVPLAPQSAMLNYHKINFTIAPKLRQDFNAYIDATRQGRVPPTQGKGEPNFARMFPTETQPRGELHHIMRHHYGFLLRWRKSMMNRPGGAAGLPGVKQNPRDSKYQDAEDLRGAEDELRKEIIFLESKDPKKFDVLDDAFFDHYMPILQNATSVTSATPIPVTQLAALLLMGVGWSVKSSVRQAMQNKQREWDTWLQDEWSSHADHALPEAASHLFETYVHDSRAWFKPFMRSDVKSMVPDAEDWFVFGDRERECKSRINASQDALAQARRSGDKAAQAKAEQSLKQLQQEGQPLLLGGREPYRLWGYVRHRCIYQAGKLSDPNYFSRQSAIEKEELARVKQQSQDERIANENARHDAELQKLRNRNREVIQSGKLSSTDQAEFTEGTRAQIARENQFHLDELKQIQGEKATSEH